MNEEPLRIVNEETLSDKLWSIGVNFATVFLLVMLMVHATCLFSVGERLKAIEERLDKLEKSQNESKQP